MSCKKCGGYVAENDLFCRDCGAKAEKEEVSTTPVTQTVQSFGVNNVVPPVTPVVTPVQPVQPNFAQNQPMSNDFQDVNFKNPKKSGNTIGLIVLAIIVLIVAVTAVILVPMLTKGQVSSPIDTSIKITNQGYIYSIPNNYTYKQIGTHLVVANPDENYNMQFDIEEYSYDKFYSKLSDLVAEMKRQGYKVNKYGKQTINGEEFIVTEYEEKNGRKVIEADSYLDENLISTAFVYDDDNTYNHDGLKKAAGIAKSMKKDSSSNNIEVPTISGLDFSIIDEPVATVTE